MSSHPLKTSENPLHILINWLDRLERGVFHVRQANSTEDFHKRIGDWAAVTKPFWTKYRIPDEAVRGLAGPVLEWLSHRQMTSEENIQLVEAGAICAFQLAQMVPKALPQVYSKKGREGVEAFWERQSKQLERTNAAKLKLRRLSEITGDAWRWDGTLPWEPMQVKNSTEVQPMASSFDNAAITTINPLAGTELHDSCQTIPIPTVRQLIAEIQSWEQFADHARKLSIAPDGREILRWAVLAERAAYEPEPPLRSGLEQIELFHFIRTGCPKISSKALLELVQECATENMPFETLLDESAHRLGEIVAGIRKRQAAWDSFSDEINKDQYAKNRNELGRKYCCLFLEQKSQFQRITVALDEKLPRSLEAVRAPEALPSIATAIRTYLDEIKHLGFADHFQHGEPKESEAYTILAGFFRTVFDKDVNFVTECLRKLIEHSKADTIWAFVHEYIYKVFEGIWFNGHLHLHLRLPRNRSMSAGFPAFSFIAEPAKAGDAKPTANPFWSASAQAEREFLENQIALAKRMIQMRLEDVSRLYANPDIVFEQVVKDFHVEPTWDELTSIRARMSEQFETSELPSKPFLRDSESVKNGLRSALGWLETHERKYLDGKSKKIAKATGFPDFIGPSQQKDYNLNSASGLARLAKLGDETEVSNQEAEGFKTWLHAKLEGNAKVSGEFAVKWACLLEGEPLASMPIGSEQFSKTKATLLRPWLDHIAGEMGMSLIDAYKLPVNSLVNQLRQFRIKKAISAEPKYPISSAKVETERDAITLEVDEPSHHPTETQAVQSNDKHHRRDGLLPFRPVLFRSDKVSDDLYIASNFAMAFTASAYKLSNPVFWLCKDERSAAYLGSAASFLSKFHVRCQESIRPVDHELVSVRSQGPCAIENFAEKNAHWVAYRIGIAALIRLDGCFSLSIRHSLNENPNGYAAAILENWETCQAAMTKAKLPSTNLVDAEIEWEVHQVESRRQTRRNGPLIDQTFDPKSQSEAHRDREHHDKRADNNSKSVSPTKAKKKCRRGKRPLEDSDPIRFQIYSRIKEALDKGVKRSQIANHFGNDTDFKMQLKQKDLKLNSTLVHRVVSFFVQRKCKMKDTQPS